MSSGFILGIEPAIAGGSVCLSDGERQIDSWICGEKVSRAEDILLVIDNLLRSNSIRLNEIGRIIVSLGPGSFTGLKVGISTVLGLRSSTGVTCRGISMLEALSLVTGGADATAAVPMGRGGICLQSFRNGVAIDLPHLINQDELLCRNSKETGVFVLHGSLFREGLFPNALDAGWNLASYLCAAVDSKFVSDDLRPLFVGRKSSNI